MTDASADAEVEAVLVYDGECPYCTVAARAMERARDVGAVSWYDEPAQAFLRAQFPDYDVDTDTDAEVDTGAGDADTDTDVEVDTGAGDADTDTDVEVDTGADDADLGIGAGASHDGDESPNGHDDVPFAMFLVDPVEGRVYGGRSAARELAERAGLPGAVGGAVGDNYETIASVVGTLSGREREAAPYHDSYPLRDDARERYTAMAAVAERGRPDRTPTGTDPDADPGSD